MKQSAITLLTFLLLFFTILVNKSYSNSREKNNIVQLAILLDTSNSMDGLIDQAKNQLWKIVNELARANKDGEDISLKVALYEYGNDNLSVTSGYIRQVVPLTTDLDKISAELFKLRTNGGSEYCGNVISNAVKELEWSEDPDQLKIIFIAGNEPFTQGNIDYRIAAREAVLKGIIVNTIYCGDYNEGVQTMWKDGAVLANGEYMNIDQDERIVHIPTPYDDDLILLGQQLNDTYIPYGAFGNKYKTRQEEQDKNASNMAPEVLVERNITKSSGQYRNDSWDLVDAKKEGKVKIDELKEDELPDVMKNMSVEERTAYVEKMKKEREEIQTQINQLNEKRRKFIDNKLAENQDNTLDAAMIRMIREQAVKKNYTFK
ncbi:von Willebrand factor type A domain protein [bacterium BMS3Abin03]|nr:von Willebrand factor type A domain protein [bacterium BMS3Abin03]